MKMLRHGLLALLFSFGVSAMQDPGQSEEQRVYWEQQNQYAKPCPPKKYKTERKTCTKNLGGIVTRKRHHFKAIRKETTLVNGYQVRVTWTDGERCSQEYPIEKSPCEQEQKGSEVWIRDDEGQDNSQQQQIIKTCERMETAPSEKSIPTKTYRKIRHENNDYLTVEETTVTEGIDTEEWDSESGEEIPGDDECEQIPKDCGQFDQEEDYSQYTSQYSNSQY